jgi:transposase
MKARRVHSTEFKVQIAREYLSHQSTLAQLSRRHELSESLIRIWVGKYKRGELSAGSSPATRERQLESRIAELERKIGQLTMENDLLKKTEEHMRRRQSENASIVSGPAPLASKRGAK